MSKKLKIVGPYTPEHEGPFCTRDGRPVRIVCRDKKTSVHDDCSIVALIDCGHAELARDFHRSGRFAISDHGFDLMNAEEVPQPREFWIALSNSGGRITCTSPEQAHQAFTPEYRKEVIHVREVLPEEDA